MVTASATVSTSTFTGTSAAHSEPPSGAPDGTGGREFKDPAVIVVADTRNQRPGAAHSSTNTPEYYIIDAACKKVSGILLQGSRLMGR